jgi:uncharacterized protein (TIGR02147 family)
MSARQDSAKAFKRPEIENYRDYRKYISDFFLFRKKSTPKFSLAFCARKLKTSTPYLKHVMAGRRHISLEKIHAISNLFSLNAFEIRCFIFLFLAEVTQDKELKEYFTNTFSVLAAQKSLLPSIPYPQTNENLRTHQKSWLHSVLHTLSEIPGFQADPKWIQAHLIRNASLEEISKTWGQLIESGEIIKKEKGWKSVERDHTPNPHDLSSFQVYKIGLDQSGEVLDHLSDYMDAYFYMGTLPMSHASFGKMGAALGRFAEEIRSISREKSNPTQVMMFSLNLMKLTK